MKKIYSIILVLFAVLFNIKAEKMLFSHYTIKDGLSSNTVNAICEDKNGFIWMATRHGICRYDGVNFVEYNSANNPIIPRNDIYHAFVLPNGRPAFSSSNGVILTYNEQKHLFEDISSFLPENKNKYDIMGQYVSQSGEHLLATACGIFQYDKQEEQFKNLIPNYLNYVLDISTDIFGHIWAGTYNGLEILDQQGNKLPWNDKLTKEPINLVFKIDDKHMLIGSTTGHAWLAELNDANNAPLFQQPNMPLRYITGAVKDKEGNIWIGTLDDGLWKCQFDGTKFHYQNVAPINGANDALTKISSLFADKDGNIWIATQSTGIWKSTPINDYGYLLSKDLGLPISVGSAFCETENGEILIGTDGMGMFLLDSTFQIKSNVRGLSSNSVLTITKDGNEYLIGYWGGATSRYSTKGQMTKVAYNGIDKPFLTTKNITKTKDGSIYVAAAGDGMYRGKDGQWERVILKDTNMNNYRDLWFEGALEKPDNSIRFYSARTIWSNLNGEYRAILPDADQSVTSNPLHVFHLVSNHENEMFAATNMGIYGFSKEDSCYGILDYVPKGEYESVVVDAEGILWASGSTGIIAIDTKNKSYKNILSTKALPSSDYFIGRASLITNDGRIFFGSKEGFVCVQPHKKNKSNGNYLAFSQLSIRGENIPCGTDILPKPLNEIEQLELRYSQNHFSIGFDMTDFSLAHKLDVKYRINDLDTAWINLGDKRTIDINYMPAGNFTIELATFDGNEMQQKKDLHLVILPPWWKSSWFMSLVALLIIGILYTIYRTRMKRLEENRRELKQKVEERTKDLNEANLLLEKQKTEIEKKNASLVATMKQKDQLVSVVAHDLKNPMFAIVATLRRLQSSIYTPAEQQSILSQLSEESEGLQKQMVNLLQWASEEDGLLNFQPSDVDVNKLADDAIALLKGMATEKGIELQKEGETAHLTKGDARMISTILRNLITNAIKFSGKGSKVAVCITENEKSTIVKVNDEGVGMPQEKIEELLSGKKVTSTRGTEKEEGFGFGFKVVLDYLHRNNGTIQINSQQGEGTQMWVFLPKSTTTRTETVQEPTVQPIEVNINKELLAGKSILVVDDDNLLLEHISALLSPYVEVMKAHDGKQGFELALEKIPDMIVSDVDMPNMNGIEMYEKLMNDALTSNIPLLFLSAKTDNNIKLKGLSIGAIDYIAKPFADEELIVKICNFLLWQQKQQQKVLQNTLKGDENNEPEEPMNPLLEQIVNLVKENYANPLYSLTDIVTELGMSKATLSRRLKSITDKTPIEILTEYRLNLSKKLLEEGNMSVSDVAYAVGFNDPSYFSRRFKEVFGSSPKSVR